MNEKMKKPNEIMRFGALLLLAGLVIPALTVIADEPRVFVVDNNGGPHADFTDLQEAVDSAEDGDIVHVLGSGTDYGSLTITRRVHLFGPGYNLIAVAGEGYQDFLDAELGLVTFTAELVESDGGEEVRSAAGSTMTGFRTGSVLVRVPDVTIKKNNINLVRVEAGAVTVDGKNIIPHRMHVIQNFVRRSIQADGESWLDHVIVNNIVVTTGATASDRTVVWNGLVRNNFFRTSLSLRIHQSTLESNLVRSHLDNSSRNSLIRNNLISGEQPDDQGFNEANQFSDNLWNVDFDTVFTETGAFDEQYQLAEESPAREAGYGGVDAGPYGGDTPYRVSGVSSLPRIRLLEAPPYIASPHSDLTIPIRIEVE